jgi:hypothetical protein
MPILSGRVLAVGEFELVGIPARAFHPILDPHAQR